jgi:hypothetical protein
MTVAYTQIVLCCEWYGIQMLEIFFEEGYIAVPLVSNRYAFGTSWFAREHWIVLSHML